MPLFSIVMPTRYRANLLRYSLQTALQQTFKDYEIVLSNNGSDPETERVALEFKDSRLRYFHTDHVLPMHDHWEFALRQARGEYIIFLSDDDAIHPGLLEILAGIIMHDKPMLIGYSLAHYHHPSWHNSNERCQLFLWSYDYKQKQITSHNTLSQIFRVQYWQRTNPKMLNSCCSSEVIERVTKQIGRFFLANSPDFSACVAMLSVTDTYLWLDYPLLISGFAAESTGVNVFRSAGRKFLEELGTKEKEFPYVPLHGFNSLNGITDTILRVKDAMPELLAPFELDWVEYFAQYFLSLEKARFVYKYDVSPEMREFKQVLHTQDPQLQDAVRRRLRVSRVQAQLAHLRTKIAQTQIGPPVKLLKNLGKQAFKGESLHPLILHQWKVTHQGQPRFDNIAECAAWLGHCFPISNS